MNNLVLCAGLFAVIALALAGGNDNQPSECYHCTLLDGDKCNNPDTSKVDIQSCKRIPTDKNTTDKVVCYTVTATWVGFPITERGCYYQEMEGEDLCAYFKRTEANVPFTFDYKCKLCYDDLCNSEPKDIQ